MIAHDFVRGTITGLPRRAVDAYRRTGRFPEDVVHPMIADAWSAVAAQKRMTIQGIGLAEVEASRRNGIVQNQVVGAAAWASFLGEGVEVTRFEGNSFDSNPLNVSCSCHDQADSSVRRGMPCGADDTGTADSVSVMWDLVDGKCVDRFICQDEIKCDESLDAKEVIERWGPAGVTTLLDSACRAAFGDKACPRSKDSVSLHYDPKSETCRVWVTCATWDAFTGCNLPILGDAPTEADTGAPDPVERTWEEGGTTLNPCVGPQQSPPTFEQCTIKIGWYPIQVAGKMLPAWHTYLSLERDSSLVRIEGEPENECYFGPGCGKLEVLAHSTAAGRGEPPSFVAMGPSASACSAINKIMDVAGSYSGVHAYAPEGPNCNTLTRQLLMDIGLNLSDPTPGQRGYGWDWGPL